MEVRRFNVKAFHYDDDDRALVKIIREVLALYYLGSAHCVVDTVQLFDKLLVCLSHMIFKR
jgi:hypothetical protein